MVGMLVLQAREKQLEVTLALRRLGAHLTGSRFGFTSLPTGKTAGQTLACHLFQTASGATQDALFLQRGREISADSIFMSVVDTPQPIGLVFLHGDAALTRSSPSPAHSQQLSLIFVFKEFHYSFSLVSHCRILNILLGNFVLCNNSVSCFFCGSYN